MPPIPSEPSSIPRPRNVISSGSRRRCEAIAASSASRRIAPPISSLSSITSAATSAGELGMPDAQAVGAVAQHLVGDDGRADRAGERERRERRDRGGDRNEQKQDDAAERPPPE